MAEAYKCDGCGKFFESEPLFKLEKLYLTVVDPRGGWTFHHVECIALWVDKLTER